MKILLDENLPEGLIEPLRELGHVVDSVGSPKLKGLDNGRLYQVASTDDLFFTKDREFAARVRSLRDPSAVKVMLTVIRQQPEPQFIVAFMGAFVTTDWTAAAIIVNDWPTS